MRIAIATTQVPFISGGAEIMTSELASSLKEHGHSVEVVAIPFRFNPPSEVFRVMDSWAAESFDRFDCGSIDKVICLKFPAFYLKHHNKSIWLMHQHRSVYELYDTPYGESSNNADAVRLRDEIIKKDILGLEDASQVFTISNRVSERLKFYNGIKSIALYQPPRFSSKFHIGEQLPYIFFPSRLETLKRQELLIRAAKLFKSSCVVVIAGDGGQRNYLTNLANELELKHKVRFLGNINDDDMVRWYSNSLGIFFGPYDEDYGFITLEAMLSGKPVITCIDSGGPLEFVVENHTGYVVDPSPQAIADAVDSLFSDRANAKTMGLNGLQHYKDLDISWNNIVVKLLSSDKEGE